MNNKKTKVYIYTRVSTAIQIILNMYKNGLAAEQIASVTGKDIKRSESDYCREEN